jgi:hypothetical protein
VATIILGIVFVLALIVLLAADWFSHGLLDPELYTNALEEEDIYNRIYTELLADPAIAAAAPAPQVVLIDGKFSYPTLYTK